MASKFNTVPPSVSNYIAENFEGAFLSKVYSSKDKQHKTQFHVNISCDHVNYYLTFNAEGVLLYTVAEPLEEILDEESYGWFSEPMENGTYENVN